LSVVKAANAARDRKGRPFLNARQIPQQLPMCPDERFSGMVSVSFRH
jgi:hypothetical protein